MGETVRNSNASSSLVDGKYIALNKRGLSEDTCRLFGYQVGKYKGRDVQIANYYDMPGLPVAQKLRFKDKGFTIIGDGKKNMGLFGQQLWSKGKKIVITEGEIDAMSVSQVQGNKWPVVSVPNGAGGAKKALAKSLSWLEENFEEIVLMFDSDEAGREAAAECAQIFSPGKCKIAHLPLKDANEMLLAGRGDEIIRAMWNAKTYRPDGIITGEDAWAFIDNDNEISEYTYPWPRLNIPTYGLRRRELVTFTAGSGVGKSEVTRAITHHLIQNCGAKVAEIRLEENIRRSVLGLLSLDLKKPLHLDREGISDEQLRDSFDSLIGDGRVHFFDHFGSLNPDHIYNHIRFLARSADVEFVVFDHISILISGIGEGDERRLLDNVMTDLRSLAEELNIGIILISHLSKPGSGRKAYEEGGRIHLSDLRGSGSIAQLSDIVIALERNQQAKQGADTTTVRILKNRYSGMIGEEYLTWLQYDRKTGALAEIDDPALESEEDNPFPGETEF